jgi:hypothetical protein
MIEQFQHKATNSFMLWFDNYLLKKGEAYSNKSGVFYYYADDRLDDRFKAFGSPYKQWVNDSSITGATIPSGVHVNGTFQPRSSGLLLDFTNGRSLISGAASSASVSGSFAVKDFNIYFTNDNEEDLIVDKKYNPNSRVFSAATSYIEPYDNAVPAIFISSQSINNDPFAFGGEDTTKIQMKALVMAENSYQLDGALSIFADSFNEVFPSIPFSGNPTTEYGDVKNGSYSYDSLKNQYNSEPLFFIEEVVTSKLSDKARKSLANDLFIGFIDFEIHQQRFPRS